MSFEYQMDVLMVCSLGVSLENGHPKLISGQQTNMKVGGTMVWGALGMPLKGAIIFYYG